MAGGRPTKNADKDYARPALNKVMLGELIDLVIRAN